MTVQLPFWTIPIIFLLGILPGIFIGWFLSSVSRLEPEEVSSPLKNNQSNI